MDSFITDIENNVCTVDQKVITPIMKCKDSEECQSRCDQLNKVDPNMPGDKKGAEIYLKARKALLAELKAESEEHEYTTLSQLSGLISNKQDDVNERLEEYLQ